MNTPPPCYDSSTSGGEKASIGPGRERGRAERPERGLAAEAAARRLMGKGPSSSG